MSSAARSLEQMPSVRYLPIDGLIASLDDALAEIREIETRRGPGTWAGLAGPTTAGALEQQQRLRDAKDYLLRAQALVYAYAKGPTA